MLLMIKQAIFFIKTVFIHLYSILMIEPLSVDTLLDSEKTIIVIDFI